jgi:hypothetical protein
MALTSGNEVVQRRVFRAVVRAKIKSHEMSTTLVSNCFCESLMTCAELSKQIFAAAGDG